MKPQPKAGRDWFQDRWLFETLTLIASCGLTVALCVVLASLDGHQTPTFGTVLNWGITLNTIVSILVTLAVAAGLSVVATCLSQLKWLWFLDRVRPICDIETFDGASRGLFGSLQLLWGHRFASVASGGALLMIVQLAIAPLAQQSLQYEARDVAIDGLNATVAIAKEYFESSDQLVSSNATSGYTSLGLAMKGGIFAGIFADPDIPINDTLPACLSGNCTFDDYPTLAVCSRSADVTKHLKNKKKKTDVVGYGKYCITNDACLTFNQTMVRSNMMSAAPLENIRDPLAGSPGRPGALKSLKYESVAFKDHVSPIADVYVIYANATDYSSDGWEYLAVEFVLDWCVPTYSTRVLNGTATSSRRKDTSEYLEKGAQSLSLKKGGEEFSVDLLTHYTLQRYMGQLLSGDIWEAGTQYYANTDVAPVFGLVLNVMGGENPYRLERGLPMLNAVLDNIATSMTNYVRKPRIQTYGKIFIQKNYVVIRWGWLAAPVAFATLCLALFVLTMGLGSRRRNPTVQNWKSSTLAVLQSPDSELRAVLGTLAAPSVIATRAEKIQVKLVQYDEGWSLVHAEDAADGKDFSPLQQRDEGLELSSLVKSNRGNEG